MQGHLRHDLFGQGCQRGALGVSEYAWDTVNHAQRAQCFTLRGQQWRPCIKLHVGFTHHQRVVGKPRIQKRIRDDRDAGCANRHIAKRHAARCVRARQPDPGLEPLPVFVHQAYQRNRNVKQSGRQLRQVVIDLLGRGVQQAVAVQGLKPMGF